MLILRDALLLVQRSSTKQIQSWFIKKNSYFAIRLLDFGNLAPQQGHLHWQLTARTPIRVRYSP